MTIHTLTVLTEKPGDGSGGPSDSTDETARDLADLSDVDDDAEEGEGESGDDGEEEDEDSSDEGGEDDVDEDEEEDEPSDSDKETKEEADTETGYPTAKSVKAEYPDFFKKFPSLRAAFFDYPKFLEVFPDTETASDAARKAEEFDALETTLVGKADATTLLKILNQNAPKSYEKMLAGFVDAVKATDEKSYTTLAMPIIEDLLYHAQAHGVRTGDKNLRLAARHLANFVWANGGEVPDISRRETKKDAPSEAEKELAKEREIHAKEKFDTALDEVVKTISKDLDDFLTQNLNGLTKFERKQVIKETRIEVDRILSADKGFNQTLRGLWKRATDSGYTSESKSRIRRAWLDRAKTLAPKIRARLKQEALDGRKTSSNESYDKSERSGIKLRQEATTTGKRQFPARGASSGNLGKSRVVLDPHKIDWGKTSDLDILRSK
jgi:hypothetical protein